MTAIHEAAGRMPRRTLTLPPSTVGADDQPRIHSRRRRIIAAVRITFKAHSAATRLPSFEAAGRCP